MNYSQFNGMDDSEIVNMVASKVSQAGNRAERRKILKALNKTKNIERYANREISKKANAEVVEQTNNSFGYIMSMAGILLHDKYDWDDDSVGNFFTEISEMLNGKWADGKSVEDVAKELYEKTGIELRIE